MTPDERLAFERAGRDGYIIYASEAGPDLPGAFRQWCAERGKPFVMIEGDAYVTLTFDTSSVWEHFLPQYQFLQKRPSYFTLDPTEDLQIQVRQVINDSGFQGGAGYGGSYTWVAGLTSGQARQAAQALLNIWEQAKAIHLDTLSHNTRA